MRRPRSRRSLAAICAVALAICGPGCARRAESFERFAPKSETARAAVVAMLDAWKRGKPVGLLKDEVDIHVWDSHRRSGQTLDRYEVVGNVVGDGGLRRITVRLTLREPDQTELVSYSVMGIDPIWVCRQEDLDMLGHWDHDMDLPGAKVKDDTFVGPPKPDPSRPASE